VVRQQLLLDNSIPYTTHNSSACAIVDCSNSLRMDDLVSRAVRYIERHFIYGSDPGLCIVSENNPALSKLTDFGLACTSRVVTQKEALEAAVGSIFRHGAQTMVS